jgi:hypothetical protein
MVHCREEHYRANQLVREHAGAIRNIVLRYRKLDLTVLDPGTEDAQRADEIFSVQSAYNRENVRTVPGQKEAVSIGLDLLSDYLLTDPVRTNRFSGEKGSPRLFISRQRCPNLWRELAGLKIAESDGRTKYAGPDHAVSAFRVILMTRPKPAEAPGARKHRHQKPGMSAPGREGSQAHDG